MSIDASGPNAEQIEFWNGDVAQSWARNQEAMDSLLAPISRVVIERSAVSAADSVLDIGCGCGSTSLAMVERGAAVTGIDVSDPMLAIARSRAEQQNLEADFILADALTHPFDPDFSLLFSRFGVMFFADPVAAFQNLSTGMSGEGRVCFACWRPFLENDWFVVPMSAASKFLPPTEPVDPRAPGPFAFSDKDYVAGILETAGYRNIEIDPVDEVLAIGDTSDIEQAIDFYVKVGPLARVIAELEEPKRTDALNAVREILQPHMTDQGLRLKSACWLVKATR